MKLQLNNDDIIIYIKYMILADYFNKPNVNVTTSTNIPTTILHNKLKKLSSENIISSSDYDTIINIIKTKGLISNAYVYFEFLNKILALEENLDIKIVVANFKIVFEHLHTLIDDNKINSINLISDISNYNDNIFEFTKDQMLAMCNISQFIYGINITKYGLNGFPGTGKTFIIAKLMHYMLGKKYLKSIVFAASTNKAVNVIKSKFRNDLDVLFKNTFGFNIPADDSFDNILDKLEDFGLTIHFLTIHKLLGYKNDFDGDGGKIFVRGQNVSLSKYELIIIDEVSMINFGMICNLFDVTVTKNSKILFVGDEGQLPPVKEDCSIIFAKKDSDFKLQLFIESFANNKKIDTTLLDEQIQEKFEKFKTQILSLQFSNLETIMRCNNNNVALVCNEQRKKIFDTKYVPQFFKYKNDKVHYYKYDKTVNKLDDKWFKKYVSYLKSTSNDKCNSLILAWTNQQVNEYNTCMRKTLFNKEVLDKFEINDILVLADFYNIKDSDPRNKSDNRFYSAEQIKVIQIEHVTKAVSPFVENLLIKVNINNILDIKEKYVRTIRTINKLTVRNYNVWKLQVVKLSDLAKTNCSSIYVIDDKFSNALENDKKIVGDKIMELIMYYKGAHKEHFATIDKHIIRVLWKEFNNKFIDTFAKVNMSYAMTTHKSQGSTFHNVFIDMIDILKNFSRDDANKCLYTAMSRTANELHIKY